MHIVHIVKLRLEDYNVNMSNIVEIENLIFEYAANEEDHQELKKAIDNISFAIEKGTFTAIIGKNGSGKSTLAKNLNGLLIPSSGRILIAGLDTRDDELVWQIRQTAGMVFQNPDNQLVSSIVEDDIAFGPENLGIAPHEIRERVDDSIAAVGMSKFLHDAPHHLSGGQKQRIAIAGVLAMKPDCIIFDEPTAMLDPQGRNDVMKIIKELSKEGITIILITHFMEEAAEADRVIIMNEGKILLDGRPSVVFKQEETLKNANMELPMAVDMAKRLRRRGIEVPDFVTTEEELVDFICQYR